MSDNYYPPPSFYFRVEIPGLSGAQGQFQEVSGLDVEVEVERLKEVGNNAYQQPVPGQTKYNNLVLKRGVFVDNSAMFTWVKETIQSNLNVKIMPRNITVSLLEPSTGNALVTWSFVGAYPVKWSLGGLNSNESALAIESIEFAYQEWKFA